MCVFDRLLIIVSFFAEFIHTDDGVTCSDSGFMDLRNAEECSDAVNYAKSFNGNAHYVSAGFSSIDHKGCFMYSSGEMYFNTHPTGGRRSQSYSICRKGNIQFLVHYSVLGK